MHYEVIVRRWRGIEGGEAVVFRHGIGYVIRTETRCVFVNDKYTLKQEVAALMQSSLDNVSIVPHDALRVVWPKTGLYEKVKSWAEAEGWLECCRGSVLSWTEEL